MTTDRHGTVETNVLRSPIWDACGRMQPDDARVTARSLLGADLKVTASRRLSVRDLAVLAAAAQRLFPTPVGHGQPPAPSPTDAHTSLYDLAGAVYGRCPGGSDVRDITTSLIRLAEVTLTLPGYDVTKGRIVGELGGVSHANLLEAVFLDHRSLRVVTARGRGKLRGTTPTTVRFSRWYADQVAAGYTTHLDLAMLRTLGTGLAARVWTFLSAERYEPKTPELEATYIGLGIPALQALDLGSYTRPRDARRKLTAAGERIVATDARYQRVELRASHYGHELMAVRLRGGQELEERRRIRATTRAAGLTPS